MRNLWKSLLAGAAILTTAGASYAADIIEPAYVPPPIIGGWYLRGDIGMSNQQLHGSLKNSIFSDPTNQYYPDNFEFLDSGKFSSAPTFRLGVGYQFNDWFRVDGTVQYRGKANFTALDRYESWDDGDPMTWDGSNQYSATKREWLVMANAYADLGTWNGITPYVGAGAGMSQNTISSFTDVNTPNNGVAYGGTNSQWEFAYALHAGLGFEVTERVTLDLGYSYLSLGDASTGDITAFNGTNNINNPMLFENITSHDFTFGLRYKFY